ncbi:MAG: hypothetical protein V4550_08075 [Gemmatimonadota bacterium]
MPFVDFAPEIDVQAAEYHRLLGYPRDHELDDRAVELIDESRVWYAAHGRPWIYARETGDLRMSDGAVAVDGTFFRSGRLRATLSDAMADRAILVAVSAGPELEAEANRRWMDDKPDEYFFLEVYGAAVVEYLVTLAGARLCADADARGLAVLPHYSPGYPGWDIAEQGRLLELFSRDGELPGALSVLESGMLRPKKSLLAVFGVTRETERVSKLTDLIPCERCSLPRCQYRRSAYGRSGVRTRVAS